MSRLARLGIFIVVALAILAGGVFLIGSKEYLFRPTYQLRAQFDNVVGLGAGADVQVGGVHSGTVRSIDLPHKPGDKVTVVMDLDSTTHEIVKRDSVASIETEGLLGNQYIAISFGSQGQGDVKNGEGVFGLRRALQEAGAQAVLMSLWSVPDKETLELMKRFYTKWLAGMEIHQALKEAQLEMREQVRKNHDGQDLPYYWGAFVLVGR